MTLTIRSCMPSPSFCSGATSSKLMVSILAIGSGALHCTSLFYLLSLGRLHWFLSTSFSSSVPYISGITSTLVVCGQNILSLVNVFNVFVLTFHNLFLQLFLAPSSSPCFSFPFMPSSLLQLASRPSIWVSSLVCGRTASSILCSFSYLYSLSLVTLSGSSTCFCLWDFPSVNLLPHPSYRRTYRPSSYHIAQELQKYNIPDYRPRQEQYVSCSLNVCSDFLGQRYFQVPKSHQESPCCATHAAQSWLCIQSDRKCRQTGSSKFNPSVRYIKVEC